MKKVFSIILVLFCLYGQVIPVFASSGNTKMKIANIRISKTDETLPDFSQYPYLRAVTVDSENPYFTSIDDVLYTKDLKTLIFYPPKKTSQSFTVNYNVVHIMSGAFSKNSYLTELTLPEGLASIGANPFAGMKNLERLILSPNNRFFSVYNNILYDKSQKILYACFNQAENITLPQIAEQIAYSAFSDCTNLSELTLPQGLKSIESMAFYNCTSLKKLDIPPYVENINPSCFQGCTKLTELTACNSSHFTSIDGILYSYDMIDLVCCPNGKKGDIIIPDGVENILNGAFDNCKRITSVIFPESMEYIARAFSHCSSLKYIEIPRNQAIIEYGTFSGCNRLEWIYLPNNVVIIQENAFLGSKPLILCDEGSFSEYYSQEHSLDYQYKFNIYQNSEKLHFYNQPIEKSGEIFLPLFETIKHLGGKTYSEYSMNLCYAELNNINAKITVNRVEKTIANQTEFLHLKNIIYKNNEIYISGEAMCKIFDINIEKTGYKINITEYAL